MGVRIAQSARPTDPLHESPRRVHLRNRAVCRVANTRNSYGYCCVMRYALCVLRFAFCVLRFAPCSPSRSAVHTYRSIRAEGPWAACQGSSALPMRARMVRVRPAR